MSNTLIALTLLRMVVRKLNNRVFQTPPSARLDEIHALSAWLPLGVSDKEIEECASNFAEEIVKLDPQGFVTPDLPKIEGSVVQRAVPENISLRLTPAWDMEAREGKLYVCMLPISQSASL